MGSWLGLKQRLDEGPAAAGYTDDQRWTLVRVIALIAMMSPLRVGITTAWQAIAASATPPRCRSTERANAMRKRSLTGAGISGQR